MARLLLVQVAGPEKRGEIDRVLTGGESFRAVAGRFGTFRMAVQRHKAHVPQTLPKAHEAREIRQADNPLASVQRLRQRLEKQRRQRRLPGRRAVRLNRETPPLAVRRSSWIAAPPFPD